MIRLLTSNIFYSFAKKVRIEYCGGWGYGRDL